MHPRKGVDGRFLLLYLRSRFFIDFVSLHSTGIAYPAISDSKFSLGVVPLPPTNEQHRIVARVEQLFAQTRALREKLARSQTELARVNESALAQLLKAETPKEFHAHWSFIAQHFDTLYAEPEHIAPLRQTILELAVRGKLTRREPADEPASELLKRIREQQDPKGFQKPFGSIRDDEKPFQLPEGWEWARLDDICSVVIDPTHHMPKTVERGVKFISAKDLLNDGTINFERDIKLISEEDFASMSRRLLPQRGDIIYSRIGARLGKARIVNTNERFMISYSCCLIRPLIEAEYLNLYLDSGIVLEQAQGHTKSIGVPDLGLKKIKGFLIALPSLQEQQRIIAKARQVKKLCDDLETKLAAARDERERLTAALLAEIA
ncbi:MAG: hypothetical protein HDKAJFGB_01553 [Anaerolineae bacterium]|nr:hypothetical protein [Anaerolineae bacterium]